MDNRHPISKKRYGCKWTYEHERLYNIDINSSKGTAHLLLFCISVKVGSIPIYQLDCNVWLQFISWIAMFDSNLSVGLPCLITIYQLDCNVAFTCNLFNTTKVFTVFSRQNLLNHIFEELTLTQKVWLKNHKIITHTPPQPKKPTSTQYIYSNLIFNNQNFLTNL